MSRFKLSLVALALVAFTASSVALTLPTKEEQDIEAWHRALANGGLSFGSYSGWGGKPPIVIDTMYWQAHTASAIVETLDLEVAQYYPAIFSDNPLMGFSIYYPYSTGIGVGVTGYQILAYPDSSVVCIPGGPVSQLIMTRPTGDTATAFTTFVVGFPMPPKSAKETGK